MADDAPKSAYELAMERLRRKDSEQGVVERPLTDEQRGAIAEARRAYEAKIAEREILHADALRRAKSHEEIAKLTEELAIDRDRLARDRDARIAAIRAQQGG
jgi:primosomal protein N''